MLLLKHRVGDVSTECSTVKECPAAQRCLRMVHTRVLLLSALITAACPSSFAEESSPRWYKGNTHTHTLWSDGNDFPEMVADWYVRNGYQFLALSDHNILHAKEVWMPEAAIAKRKLALGKSAMEKYRARFGDEWVQTREVDGKVEVRLKKLEEYRPHFEKPGEFLFIQAEELSAGFLIPPKQKVPVHINALNIREEMQPIEANSIREVLRVNLKAIREQGERLGIPVLAHVNHPNFRWALTAEDLAEVLEEDFFEIYNGHPKIYYGGDEHHMGHEKIWDVANTLRLTKLGAPPLYGLGTDDSHHYHGEDSSPGRGWIMVRATTLSPEAIIKSMRAGDFYASSGVALDDVSFKDGTLKLRIHAEPGASYTTQIVGTPVEHDASTRDTAAPADDPQPVRKAYSDDVGKTFATVQGTEVSYTLTGKEIYIRAVITSSQAHPNPSYPGQTQMAWTQPVGWKVPSKSK